MAQVTRRYRTHMGELRRQMSFRTGDERTILKGWYALMEKHINRLEHDHLSPTDTDLAMDVLDMALVTSGRHLDDIKTLKMPPWKTKDECDAYVALFRKIVEDAPWERPMAQNPKAPTGGRRVFKCQNCGKMSAL